MTPDFFPEYFQSTAAEAIIQVLPVVGEISDGKNRNSTFGPYKKNGDKEQSELQNKQS